jgi:quinol monooxygenase YgiN
LSEAWIRDRNCFSTRFHVDPARREEFLQTFTDMCATAARYYDRGCKFAFQGWARDPNEFVVFASWDEDVVRELRADPDFKRLTAALLDCCDAPNIMEQYSGMNIDRSIFDAYPAGESSVHNPGQQKTIFL